MKKHTFVVRVAIKAPDGSFILLKRSTTQKWSPGKYELPGGKVSLEHEQPAAAAKREVEEEIGYKVSKEPRLFYALKEEWEGRLYLVLAYLIEVGEQLPIQLSGEHSKSRWVSMGSLQQFEITSHTQEILNAVFTTHLSLELANKTQDEVVEKSMEEELIIYTDGGSRGNPGPSASGYVIMDEHESVLEEGGEYLGITTNNQAEYQAVRLALEQAAKYHPKRITYRIDSELIVKQMNGQYKIKNRDLWPIHARIKELMSSYESVHFVHVAREFNRLADAKVNEILDAHAK